MRADQGKNRYSSMVPRPACGESSTKENREEIATCARSKPRCMDQPRVRGPRGRNRIDQRRAKHRVAQEGGNRGEVQSHVKGVHGPKLGMDLVQGGEVDQRKVGFELLFMKSNISKEFELGSMFNPNFSLKHQF